MLKRFVLIGTIVGTLTACVPADSTLKDGYQFGDVTGEALRLQTKYCETKDELSKILLLKITAAAAVTLHVGDICSTNLLSLLE